MPLERMNCSCGPLEHLVDAAQKLESPLHHIVRRTAKLRRIRPRRRLRAGGASDKIPTPVDARVGDRAFLIAHMTLRKLSLFVIQASRSTMVVVRHLALGKVIRRHRAATA